LPWARYLHRRLTADDPLDFLGKNGSVTPLPNKVVPIGHHPGQRFWIIPHVPDPAHPLWPDVLAHPQL
jgi:hypothetical protein